MSKDTLRKFAVAMIKEYQLDGGMNTFRNGEWGRGCGCDRCWRLALRAIKLGLIREDRIGAPEET